MKSFKPFTILVIVSLAVATAFALRLERSEEALSSAPEERVVTDSAPTFIELGSDRCTSCRAMVPVLEELRTTHGCNLDVRFIDVWDNPDEGDRFGVTTIPTQVLLASDGREITRHTGFWSAEAIRAAFASGGYPLAGGADCNP